MKLQSYKTWSGIVHFVIIPKAIIDGFSWKKGDMIEHEIMGKDKIKLERVKNSTPKNTGGNNSE